MNFAPKCAAGKRVCGRTVPPQIDVARPEGTIKHVKACQGMGKSERCQKNMMCKNEIAKMYETIYIVFFLQNANDKCLVSRNVSGLYILMMPSGKKVGHFFAQRFCSSKLPASKRHYCHTLGSFSRSGNGRVV